MLGAPRSSMAGFLNNRWLGAYIKNYGQKKGMLLKIKIIIVVLL
jgi:uncharacterized membrane protein YbaN (DUF454 family)